MMRSPSFVKTAATCLFVILLIGGTDAAGQERFRKSPPAPEPLPELRLPPIERHTLSNGLQLAVVPRPRSPFMHLRLIIQAGEADSPENRPGVAALTATLLNRGTAALSAADIEERIEGLGAVFQASAHMDYSSFSMTVLEEHLDDALELLKTLLLQAAFSAREVESAKKAMYYELVEKSRDPEFVANRHMFRLLFEDHPYAKIAYSEDALTAIGQKDIAAFFENFYRPNNAILVLTGNLNLGLASRKASHHLNTWASRKIERDFIPPPPPNKKLRVAFIDVPRSRDAVISTANVIMPPMGADLFPFLVLNHVLGGTTGSRLFLNLRETNQYAYYAFSETEFFRTGGVFKTRARIIPDAASPALREILQELQAAVDETVTPFDIEQAKAFLIGNFPLRIESLENVSRRAALMSLFNLGEDHWNRYYDGMRRVNLNAVRDVARNYLQLPPIAVIAGSRDRIVDTLRNFEVVQIYDAKGTLRSTIVKGVEK
jgi:zinc protease